MYSLKFDNSKMMQNHKFIHLESKWMLSNEYLLNH